MPSRSAGAPAPPAARRPDGSRRRAFDWDLVWSEILRQEDANPLGGSTETILDCLPYLAEIAGIRAPFLDRMKRRVLDGQTVSPLRGGILPTTQIVDLLAGGGTTGTMIRNRIDSMERSGIVVKSRSGRRVHVRAAGAPTFPRPGWAATAAHVESYLARRFRLRRPPPDGRAGSLAGELRRAGLCTMGDLDRAVRDGIELLRPCDPAASSDSPDRADAALLCAGIRSRGA